MCDELSYVEYGVKLCSLAPVWETFWQWNCSDGDISCNACQYHDIPQRLMMSGFTDISEMWDYWFACTVVLRFHFLFKYCYFFCTDSLVWCCWSTGLWRTAGSVSGCDRTWSSQTYSWVSFWQYSAGARSTICSHTCSCHSSTWVCTVCYV